MASNNYIIQFRSLRGSTDYELAIGGGSGTAIKLKGGAQPFTTEEDSDEDPFKPVRTQTGYFRIVDDNYDAEGNNMGDGWWKDLIPATDTERPVTLYNGSTVIWQGFMQAQNFGGTLYGNPQEREFPVQCILSVLGTYKASTSESGMKNFAWLLKWLLVDNLPSAQRPTAFYVQGGADARAWLLKRFDWMNFMREVEDNDIESAYSHYDILEDMCKFWGWTCRVYRKSVYLMCVDDSTERNRMLTLDQTSLGQLANDTNGSTTAGTVSTNFMPSALAIPDAFASTDNDTYQNQGPSKATVKVDINKNESVIKFAPNSVRKQMEAAGGNTWTWVTKGDLVGYYETGHIGGTGTSACLLSFDAATLAGNATSGKAGFARRQVYSTKEQDKPAECDMILFNHYYDGSAVAMLRTKKKMAFAGGSLKLKGSVYADEDLFSWPMSRLKMRIGIGDSESSAKWFGCQDVILGSDNYLDYEWATGESTHEFSADANAGQIKSIKVVKGSTAVLNPGWDEFTYDRIPVPNQADFYGYLFVKFLGLLGKADTEYANIFQVANFEVEFSRDTCDIPHSLSVVRQREIKEERVSTKEYTATNNSRTQDEWNADCIFASDNNMEYGYGLLTNPNGTFMQTAPYVNNNEHPEQHLANRVASYWQTSKRRVRVELQSQATITNVPVRNAINPGVLVTIDGTTGYPFAISHNYRDDVTTITMLQIPI